MTGVELLSDGASPTFIGIVYCGFRQNTQNIFKNDYAKRIFATKSCFFGDGKKNLGGGVKMTPPRDFVLRFLAWDF